MIKDGRGDEDRGVFRRPEIVLFVSSKRDDYPFRFRHRSTDIQILFNWITTLSYSSDLTEDDV